MSTGPKMCDEEYTMLSEVKYLLGTQDCGCITFCLTEHVFQFNLKNIDEYGIIDNLLRIKIKGDKEYYVIDITKIHAAYLTSEDTL